ncbi:hypothetical protein [Priestia megaterium]|uniref:hypothetical protein n=1 Tax=Priestia megaterium TaxID=1404 RepID=UPI00279588BD|nr:hypothetical protein [Priestia megaterium]
METNDLYRVKHIMTLQVIRDILIENGFTTHENFKERLLDKVENSQLKEEIIEALKDNIG